MAPSTSSGQARTALRTRSRAEPFLKWAGGKTQLLSQFARLYPTHFGRYIEPFVGSGAVFFDIRERLGAVRERPLRATLSDNNRELINCYQAVRDDVETLVERLAEHKERHQARFPDHYYEVREWLPNELTSVERAARLIYLNKTCYNGLYRVNARGQFNVPVGRYKNPPICDANLLQAASRALQGVDLRVRQFWQWARYARPGDFFYIDPPYFPLSKTANFTSYTQGGFGPDEQRRLADFVRELDAKGCLVMVSNSDTKFIRDLYRGFRKTKVYARRAINSNGGARGAISELVITNYKPKG